MIHASGLGIEFEGRWIFRHLELEAAEGESIVLLGPSGSGKSIFLKIIARLIQPSEGTVRTKCRELGMLFQKNALFDSFSVEENLLFPLRERKGIVGKEAARASLELLEAVGLGGSAKLMPHELSGGMQKRLGIARALILKPDAILYDEPTAGLDPVTSRLIADLMLRLKKEQGTTLITVTNEVQRAFQLGDRVFLLAHGKLHGGESPEKMRKDRDPSIRQFIFGLKDGPLSSGLA